MLTPEIDFLEALYAQSDEHERATIVDAVFAVAASISAVAGAIQRLGLGDAATRRGAIECLIEQLGRTGELIAGGLGEIAMSIDPPSPPAVDASDMPPDTPTAAPQTPPSSSKPKREGA